MWFKQAQLFELSGKVLKKADSVESKLSNFSFTPCLASLPSSHGWVAPIDVEAAPLVHAANGYLLICLQVEEKLLPASVVNQNLANKIKQFSKEEQRPISRKEKADLKSEITLSLLPQAFSRMQKIYAYFAPEQSLLILNTSNKRATELFLDAMQKTFPALKLKRPETKRIATQLTNWCLNDKANKKLWVEKNCVLQDINYKARTIRVSEQELSAKPISQLIADGCEVKQLALNWQDRIRFTLGEDFIFRNIKFTDIIQEQAKVPDNSDPLVQFDADFAILSESFTELFNDIFPLLLKTARVSNPEPA